MEDMVKKIDVSNPDFIEFRKKFNINFKYEKGFEFGNGRFVITDYVIDTVGNFGYEFFDREKRNVHVIQENELESALKKLKK